MSTIEEHLTGRGTSYEAKVQAAVYDGKSSPTGSDEHIHISRRVDIQTLYPPAVYSERFTRLHAPPKNSYSHSLRPATWYDKELPALPDFERGSF
jgi:hypothetical protein